MSLARRLSASRAPGTGTPLLRSHTNRRETEQILTQLLRETNTEALLFLAGSPCFLLLSLCSVFDF